MGGNLTWFEPQDLYGRLVSYRHLAHLKAHLGTMEMKRVGRWILFLSKLMVDLENVGMIKMFDVGMMLEDSDVGRIRRRLW